MVVMANRTTEEQRLHIVARYDMVSHYCKTMRVEVTFEVICNTSVSYIAGACLAVV